MLARAAPALLIALTVAGCGAGHANSARKQLAAYIDHVNRIEKQLQRPLNTVADAGRSFATDQTSTVGAFGRFVTGSQQGKMLGALGQMRRLRVRLAALEAPAPATRLRALLLEVVDRQEALTMQTAELIGFLPGFQAALKPLTPALARLERALSVKGGSGAAAVRASYLHKGLALRVFEAEAVNIVTALDRLRPPQVARPLWLFQVHALRRMHAAAAALVVALYSGRLGGVPRLLYEFELAAAAPRSLAAQRAEIAAVKAYDARITALNRLAQRAEAQRYALSLAAG
jgi:hypothetical protein